MLKSVVKLCYLEKHPAKDGTELFAGERIIMVFLKRNNKALSYDPFDGPWNHLQLIKNPLKSQNLLLTVATTQVLSSTPFWINATKFQSFRYANQHVSKTNINPVKRINIDIISDNFDTKTDTASIFNTYEIYRFNFPIKGLA